MPDCAGNLTQLLESDLLQAGWHPDDESGGDPIGPRRYCFQSLRKSLLKKYLDDDPKAEEARNQKALDLFIAENDECRSWVYSPTCEDVERAIGEAQATLDRFSHPEAGRGLLLTFGSICQGFDVGKGANIGHTNVDFYSKVMCSTATSTSIELLDLYRAAISSNPTWNRAEKSREERMGSRIVLGSKVTFATKNREISRTICTEPLVNMLFQKGIESEMNLGLRRVFSIDLTRQQDHNRELARIGSLTGRFATLDLKSASNRNATNMVKMMFPPTFTKWLEKTRSPCAILPDGRVVELHMLSSMGNAFTFPLQTALFAGVVMGCYKVLGIKPKYPTANDSGNFAVFGDDIIVEKEAYHLVSAVLTTLGHIVNHDKSFSEGPFRESCGSDWYSGHNVRGVYIKRLADDADFYSAINRLNAWSGIHQVPLVNTVGYLLSCVERKLFVPMHETETAGIRLPLDALKEFLPPEGMFGYSYKYLHIRQYKVVLHSEESLIHEMMVARKSYLKSGRKGPKSPKVKYLAEKAWYNAEGHLLSALAGRLRDGSFAVREFKRRTVVKRRSSSCWDWTGSIDAERRHGESIRTFSRANIGDVAQHRLAS